MTVCPKCNEEFDKMYELFRHCWKNHPEVEFEFEPVYIGNNPKPLKWPTKVKEMQMESEMEFTQFVRKPFVVEAVKVTEANIGEVAKYVGELKQKDDGTPFIYVDRRLVPNVYRVYPGFYMTRMGDHIRCYSPKVFGEQFVVIDNEIQAWVDYMNGKTVEEIVAEA